MNAHGRITDGFHTYQVIILGYRKPVVIDKLEDERLDFIGHSRRTIDGRQMAMNDCPVDHKLLIYNIVNRGILFLIDGGDLIATSDTDEFLWTISWQEKQSET